MSGVRGKVLGARLQLLLPPGAGEAPQRRVGHPQSKASPGVSPPRPGRVSAVACCCSRLKRWERMVSLWLCICRRCWFISSSMRFTRSRTRSLLLLPASPSAGPSAAQTVGGAEAGPGALRCRLAPLARPNLCPPPPTGCLPWAPATTWRGPGTHGCMRGESAPPAQGVLQCRASRKRWHNTGWHTRCVKEHPTAEAHTGRAARPVS